MVLLINHYYYYWYYFVMALIKGYFPQRGEECGRGRLTPRTPDLGSSLDRRVVSLDKELYSSWSLLRGNPAKD